MADLMCECKSPAHPWEPGESCPPERVVNGGRELIARAIVALEKLHEDPQATYEDMARAVLSLTSDEAEWWASERLDLQAECREANASEAAAIERARELRRNFAVLNRWLNDEYGNAYERFVEAERPGTSSAADGRAQAFLDVSRFINSAPSLAENVLSREEAQLVVKALLPAVSGTPEAALSDRLGDFAFPDDDEPYKPHPATVPGGTYLPPDARPDSTGLPEFGDLPSTSRLDTLKQAGGEQ